MPSRPGPGSADGGAGQGVDRSRSLQLMRQRDGERDEDDPAPTRRADRHLCARLVAGDESALGEIYDAHASLVYGLARRVTNDEAIAQDITQEVFCHAWEHADRIDVTRGSIRSYLGVLTHRRAVDACRRESRLRAHAARDAATTPLRVDDITAFHDHIELDDRVRALRSALETLPAEQREALTLAYFGGRTYRQVAVELDIPEGTAKSRLRLALSRLREVLEPEMLPSWT